MKWNEVRPWLGTVIRLGLGAIWIWAATSKLGNPRTFTQTVRAYDATPEWLSKTIGYGLPVLELAVGILLVVGIVVRVAAAVSGVLFVVFLVGLIQAAVRNIQLECGCFGGGGATNSSTHYTLDILRDVGLLILAAYLVWWPFTRLSLEEYLGRHDYVEPPSAKRMRSEQGRRKYNAMVAARQAKARSRDAWVTASLAAVVVLIVLIGIGVQSNRAEISGSLKAKNVTVASGVVYGKKAAATVDVYEDFQCPHCLEFEQAVGKTLDADVQANKAQVRFHPISFLDSSSDGNKYSSRADNAALCAATISVDDFVALHNILYGKLDGAQVQPTEGSNGRTNAQLYSYGKAAGITGTNLTNYEGCVRANTHAALVEALTERSSEDGVTATPTIKVNGKSITASLSAFNSAVAAALVSGPKPVPSVTPSPSPSVTPSATVSPSTTTSAGSSTTRTKAPGRTKKASATPTAG